MSWSTPLVSAKAEGVNAADTSSTPINTTGATFLIMTVAWYTPSGEPTIADSYTNTWELGLTTYNVIGAINLKIYYCKNPIVGSGHTFSATKGAMFGSLVVAAFSGGDITSPFDVENGTGNSSSPGAITPNQDNELVITGLGYFPNNNQSINGGFTVIDYVNSGSGNYDAAMAYLIQTSAASANPSWTGSTFPVANIASFKVAATGYMGNVDNFNATPQASLSFENGFANSSTGYISTVKNF